MIRARISLALLAGLLAAPVLAAPPKADPPVGGEQQYDSCMQLARNNPRQAFATANAWYDNGGGAAAQHCAAVALFNSGDYVEAANRLEHLANDGLTVRRDLRAGLYAQAGQAWLRASLIDQALRAQSNALTLEPDNVEYLIDRSVTLAGIGRLDDAIADLGRALKVNPRKYEALTLRATAYRLQAKTAQAASDVDQAIRLAPDYPEAYLERGIQRRLRSDAGARDDFIKVLRLVPKENDLAVQASKELERSDLKR
jgi:tetratricopeptide (TPR) repeat protein